MSTNPHWNKGKRSYNWKGGKILNKWGYVEVWAPDHPNAKKGGYIREHRLIMSEYLGRPLTIDEEVHHKNGNKEDNRIENLQLIKKAEHTILHHRGKRIPRRGSKQCIYPNCSELTARQYGLCVNHYKSQWVRVKKGLASNLMEFPHQIRRKRTTRKE